MVKRSMRLMTFWAFVFASVAALSMAVSPPEKAGFPAILTGGGPMQGGHAAVADLGLTPGHKSIIFGTANKLLYVVLYNGQIAPGWPQTLPAETVSSPAVADLDGDGIPEIVIGYGSTFDPSDPGGVVAYHRDGTLLWNRSLGITGGVGNAVQSSPAIGDVEGTGFVDVAFASFDQHVYLVRGTDGTDRPGWPHFVFDSVFSSPALYDIDGDGKLEVIIGVDAHLEPAPINTPDGGCIHVIRYDSTEVPGFPQCVNQVMSSSPAVGDINGDGIPEIIIGTGLFWTYATGVVNHNVYAFEPNGTQLAGWPVQVTGEVTTGPALADLDGDGIPEVVVTDIVNVTASHACSLNPTPPCTTYNVYAFKGNGTQLFKTAPLDSSGVTLSAGDPVVADVLGDSHPEILVPTNGEICVLSNTGVQLTDNGTHPPGALTFAANGTTTTAVVDDFESDGQFVEVVTIAGNPFPTYANTEINVYNPKVPVYPGKHVHFYTLPPCRLFDTRKAVPTYGSPALVGNGARRDFPVTEHCGVPVDAVAVSGNITVINPLGSGDLRVYSAAAGSAPSSAINFASGRTRANNVIVPLSSYPVWGAFHQNARRTGVFTWGLLEIQCDITGGSTNATFDINGYFR